MEEVVAGIFKFIGRAIVQVFVELIFELLIKGPGYIIVMLFSINKEKEPTENQSLIVGIIFWSVIGICVYLVFKYAL